MNKNVFLVSYPRSGQHYTQHLLEAAADKEIYCIPRRCLNKNCPAKDYPENLKSPCYSGRPVQKHHDFGLKLKVNSFFKYAVLIRNPLYSIQSYYEWERKNNGCVKFRCNGKPKKFTDDSESVFFRYAENKAIEWSAFVEKWQREEKQTPDLVKVFHYEHITKDAIAMQNIVEFCLSEYNFEKLEMAIQKQVSSLKNGSRKLRELNSFRYYDQKEYARLAKIAGINLEV